MLRRAIDRGVSRERLARAFNVNLSAINRRINRLQGICPEATNWLQDKHFPPDVTRILRNMNSARQVEAMELMVSINTITGEQRLRPTRPVGGEGLHDQAAVKAAVNSFILRHESYMLGQFNLVVTTVSMEEAVQLQGGQAETAAALN